MKVPRLRPNPELEDLLRAARDGEPSPTTAAPAELKPLTERAAAVQALVQSRDERERGWREPAISHLADEHQFYVRQALQSLDAVRLTTPEQLTAIQIGILEQFLAD